jgi:hypothetical protein
MREEETEALHRPRWVHAHAPRRRPRSTGAARARPPTVGPRWLGGWVAHGFRLDVGQGRREGDWLERWLSPGPALERERYGLRVAASCVPRSMAHRTRATVLCGAVQLGPGECNAASLYLVLRRRCYGWSSGPSGAVGLPAPPPSADGSW